MNQKTTHKCDMYLYHLSSGDKDLWSYTLGDGYVQHYYATLSISAYDFSIGEAPCIYDKSHSKMVNNNICKITVIIKRLKKNQNIAIVLLYNCVSAHAYGTKYPYTPYQCAMCLCLSAMGHHTKIGRQKKKKNLGTDSIRTKILLFSCEN